MKNPAPRQGEEDLLATLRKRDHAILKQEKKVEEMVTQWHFGELLNSFLSPQTACHQNLCVFQEAISHLAFWKWRNASILTVCWILCNIQEVSAEEMAERAKARAADLAESLQERAKVLAATAEERENKLLQREEELNSILVFWKTAWEKGTE